MAESGMSVQPGQLPSGELAWIIGPPHVYTSKKAPLSAESIRMWKLRPSPALKSQATLDSSTTGREMPLRTQSVPCSPEISTSLSTISTVIVPSV